MFASVVADVRRAHSSWRTILVRAGIAYVLTRLCVLMGAGVVAAQKLVEQKLHNDAHPMSAVSWIINVLSGWDGRWYFEIARHGYPTVVPPNVTYDMPEARA